MARCWRSRSFSRAASFASGFTFALLLLAFILRARLASCGLVDPGAPVALALTCVSLQVVRRHLRSCGEG